MKINSKVYDYVINNYSKEQLEQLLNQKKTENHKIKLRIAKKSLINQKLDYQLYN